MPGPSVQPSSTDRRGPAKTGGRRLRITTARGVEGRRGGRTNRDRDAEPRFRPGLGGPHVHDWFHLATNSIRFAHCVFARMPRTCDSTVRSDNTDHDHGEPAGGDDPPAGTGRGGTNVMHSRAQFPYRTARPTHST